MKFMYFARLSLLILTLFFVTVILYGFFSVDFSQFILLLQDKSFLNALTFTLKTSLSATLFSFVLGVPAGYFLARKKHIFSYLMDILFDIPIVIPPLIVGVFLMNIFNSSFLKNIYDFIFTIEGATIAQFFIAFPFTVKASKSAFELVSPIYERIAMTLGASSIRSFYDTTFKIALSGILSGLILTWLRCVGEFGATLMVGGGISDKTENLPVYIYINMISGDTNKAMAAGVLTVFIAFICVMSIKVLFRFSNLKSSFKSNIRK